MASRKQDKQKKVTKKFFNDVSGEWYERTYNPSGKYLRFPVNGLRKDVALAEIDILGKKGSVLDIGCGTGHMVIDLLKAGRKRVVGIDIAEKMIEEARKYLKASKIKEPKHEVFRVMDLAELEKRNEKYDIVTGLGLLEYLSTDEELFGVLKKVVNKGGYALIECRNQMFNLFTGNKYTKKEINDGNFKKLINEFEEINKWSPVKDKDIPEIEKEVYKKVSRFLNSAVGNKNWNIKNNPTFTSFPKTMVRRQHTPKDLANSAKKFGFNLEYVSYYHIHPYLPAYEKEFPQIYNKISELMTPLGRTSIGSYTGSAFIGILKKK